jgi:preprotein translocase subunit SecF
MHIIKKDLEIDFLGKRKIAFVLSATLLVISLLAIFTRGFNFGIDFTGGTLIEVGYPEPVDLAEVRSILETADFGDVIVQHFGTSKDILIRLAPRAKLSTPDLSDAVLRALEGESKTKVKLRRVEFVGPQVGSELTEQGGLAMLWALIGILVYVALRFEYRFAVGAVIALIHDVTISLGLFAIGQFEFDLTVVAALLAVIGYSLNDTIVVFDRARENFRKMRKGTTFQIMNASLNQTLSRTLITSLTTVLVLLALLFFGGKLIRSFALALIFGVFIGTYSSIFIAVPAALVLGVSRKDLLAVKKEGATVDERP